MPPSLLAPLPLAQQTEGARFTSRSFFKGTKGKGNLSPNLGLPGGRWGWGETGLGCELVGYLSSHFP